MPTVSEYKGHAMLVLNPGDKFEFQFGLGKAKMILEHVNSIRAFVDSDGKACDADTKPKPQPDF